jgi:hypothetical protein
VIRSVLASEPYALAHGFGIAALLRQTLNLFLDGAIPLIIRTDSKSIFDQVVKLGTTPEKRLPIDVMCLREAGERRETTEVKWIEGDSNPADSVTKAKPSGALLRLYEAVSFFLRPPQIKTTKVKSNYDFYRTIN